MNKKWAAAGTILLLSISTWFFTGIFVVQPIGAIPDGATVWYWRIGTNLPFVASADGMLMDSGQGVSLIGRAVFLGKMGEFMKDKKIASFGYSKAFYLFSTGGKEFEK